MSYDIDLVIDTGGPEPARLQDEYWNYTSNVAPMWRLAMPETDGLAGLHGVQAGEAAKVLRVGIAHMENEPAVYRALNPANNWGDFESQLDALKQLMAWCERHPRATVEVCR